MPDLEIKCLKCEETFLFSERDQETFYRRNYAAPQYCPQCRPSKRKIESGNVEKLYEITCDLCSKPDRVNFPPKVGRSILCRNCHAASRARQRVARHIS